MGATRFYRTIEKDYYIDYESDVKGQGGISYELGGIAYEFYTHDVVEDFSNNLCAEYSFDPIKGCDDLMEISIHQYMKALSIVLKNRY